MRIGLAQAACVRCRRLGKINAVEMGVRERVPLRVVPGSCDEALVALDADR
jgi:hypothetical protein